MRFLLLCISLIFIDFLDACGSFKVIEGDSSFLKATTKPFVSAFRNPSPKPPEPAIPQYVPPPLYDQYYFDRYVRVPKTIAFFDAKLGIWRARILRKCTVNNFSPPSYVETEQWTVSINRLFVIE